MSAAQTATANWKGTASFSGLSSPTITYGTATTAVSGHVAAGSLLPAAGETVTVTLNGVNKTATLDASGNFSTSFTTNALTVGGGPYTVSYAYAGDSGLTSASGSSTLTVNKATLTVTPDAKSKTYGSANPALTYTLSGFVNGETSGVVSGSASLSTA